MDYIQQVVVNIEAAKLGDAQALINELETHREEARRRPGFVSMQISRAIEQGGETQLTIETRWRGAEALGDYAQGSDNVAGIIDRHAGAIVGDSLRVRRLEALDATPAADKTRIVYERFAIAGMVPLVIVGIGLAIIYMLSRVYLEVPSEAATFIALVVALGILLVAWYFAANPKVPGWQMAGAGALTVGALLVGTVTAAVHPGPEHHSLIEETETPGGEETPTAPDEKLIVMHDNSFDPSSISAPANTETVFAIRNEGNALHNVQVSVSGDFPGGICDGTGENPCSDPPRIRGGQEGTLTINLPAGDYAFRCDFHPVEMTGTLSVQ